MAALAYIHDNPWWVNGLRPYRVGVKVGLVGLAEEEWIATLTTVTEDQLDYEDFVQCGRRLAADLREKQARAPSTSLHTHHISPFTPPSLLCLTPFTTHQ